MADYAKYELIDDIQRTTHIVLKKQKKNTKKRKRICKQMELIKYTFVVHVIRWTEVEHRVKYFYWESIATKTKTKTKNSHENN